MVVSLKHFFTSPKADGTDSTLVQPSNWNAEHVLTQATARLLGRTTASTGPTEEITVGSNLSFTGLTLALNSSVSITALTASGLITGGSLTISGDADFTGTGSVKVPVGTTAQRPTPVQGDFRFNSTLTAFEGYNGTAWSPVGGGATGGGTDAVFYENGQTVATNYTVTSGKNAMSAGPVTINSGISVTVPSGSVWTVV
jgi:hypothetical protein